MKDLSSITTKNTDKKTFLINNSEKKVSPTLKETVGIKVQEMEDEKVEEKIMKISEVEISLLIVFILSFRLVCPTYGP